MLDKNVVMIETLETIGTGYLYPCEYNFKREERFEIEKGNSFLLITNKHILQNVYDGDIKEDIHILMYDDYGDRIENESILDIEMFRDEEELSNEKYEDIAALLIVLKRGISLTINNKICTRDIVNRQKLYVEGYPGILLNQQIGKKIQLEGLEKNIFPRNNKVGAYQITDDYHWYNNMSDISLLEGLSGSPVYMYEQDKEYVIGLNQSVVSIDNGKNPFKMVYYIRIEYIMNYLRIHNCIIYRKIDETEYIVEWIFKESEKQNKELLFLLIGGSGAGKSSIVKNFAFNGQLIDSVNDGQTTRTDIIYEYSVMEKDTKAEIYLLNQKEFCERMISNINTEIFSIFFEEIFGLTKDFVKDEKKLFGSIKDLLLKIYEFKEIEETKEKDILKKIDLLFQDELLNLEKVKLYEEIFKIILCESYRKYLKYLLDEEQVRDLIENYLDNSLDSEEEVKSILKNIFGEPNIKEFELERAKIEEFRKSIITIIKNNNSQENGNSKNEVEKLFNDLYSNKFKKLLMYNEGFFSIKEFDFLLENEVGIKNTYDYICLEEEEEKYEYENDDNENLKIINLYSRIDDDLKVIHKKLKGLLMKKYRMYYNKKKFFQLPFYDMDMKTQDFLSKCLQVTKKGSLTGIVQKVIIKDKICNDVAFIMKEFEISKLKVIDTYGLDHVSITSNKEIVRRLNDYYYKYILGNKGKIENIAVIYVKKLDSGKPDELRTYLPCIRKSIPQAPVYCMFTGIDIFYNSISEIETIDWSFASDRCPKAVKYLIEMNNIVDKNKITEYQQYLVMRNNIIPYCSKKELIESHYIYQELNYRYVRKLFASISMKEYSSLGIIEWEEEIKKEIGEIAEKVVSRIFIKASLEVSRYKWNTINADDVSFFNDKLGYAYTYRHCFFQLFHDAYSSIMDEYADKYIQKLCSSKYDKNAIKSAMISMESLFLGNKENLYNMKLDEERKNKFRKILEKMYEEKEKYTYNIFKIKEISNELFEDNKKKKIIKPEKRKELFSDIFDFAKGLNCKIIINKNNQDANEKTVRDYLAEFFVECFQKQIEKDNLQKTNNLVRVSEDYYKNLKCMEKEFQYRYGMDDRKSFYKLMSQYFENALREEDK